MTIKNSLKKIIPDRFHRRLGRFIKNFSWFHYLKIDYRHLFINDNNYTSHTLIGLITKEYHRLEKSSCKS